jgi:hypothetical protein
MFYTFLLHETKSPFKKVCPPGYHSYFHQSVLPFWLRPTLITLNWYNIIALPVTKVFWQSCHWISSFINFGVLESFTIHTGVFCESYNFYSYFCYLLCDFFSFEFFTILFAWSWWLKIKFRESHSTIYIDKGRFL